MLVLALLYFFLPLVYSRASNDLFKIPKIVFFQLGSFSAFCLIFTDALRLKKYTMFHKNSVRMLVVVFLLVNLLSFLFVKSEVVAFKDFLLSAIGLVLLLVLSAQEHKILARLCLASFVSAFLVSCIGILQHADSDLTGISALSGVPASFMASTLGHRNYLAELLCMTFPFGFYFYLSSEKSSARSFYFTALSLMFLSLLITNSRSGWLSFALSTLFFYPS